MLVYLFSSNYSNPSTGGGISSDLCRSNSLGTSHSRHESESEWLAVSAKWLESVKSYSTGLETKSACGLDCENYSSTGLVYKWGGVWKWGLGIVSLCELVFTPFYFSIVIYMIPMISLVLFCCDVLYLYIYCNLIEKTTEIIGVS